MTGVSAGRHGRGSRRGAGRAGPRRGAARHPVESDPPVTIEHDGVPADRRYPDGSRTPRTSAATEAVNNAQARRQHIR
ncbi:hypothetical protein HBB16_18165 [Pseudonocardia sp. MCCB 268]|nr:hypothetical protein [Pseudonocardia cytotoxica]